MFVGLMMTASAVFGGAHGYEDDYYEGWGTGPEGQTEFEPLPPVTLEVGDSFTAPAIGGVLGPLGVQVILRDDYFADVVFQNRLARQDNTPEQITFNSDAGPIIVYLDGRPGDEPDVMTVIAPPGYYALPAEVTVGENDIGVIQIHEGGLS